MAHESVARSGAMSSNTAASSGSAMMPRELNDDEQFVRRFSLTPRESTTAAAATVADRLADRLLDMRQSVIVASSTAATEQRQQQRSSLADIFTTETAAAAVWPPGGAESVGASPRSAGVGVVFSAFLNPK
jgi:hypothetical protein